MRPGRHLAWLLLRHAVVRAHVPTYDSGIDNCFVPPKHHDISQVIYLKGTGGLEVHINRTTAAPFDKNKEIDFDAVFQEKYDQSSYELYVGCGGCVTGDAYVPASRITPDEYQEMSVEPFTQTNYFSAFKKKNRKFDTRKLLGCTEDHFTIRLKDLHNRKDADGNAIQEPLVWGAVIGLAERFTWYELFLFPTYILKNHGASWNQQAWTWPVILVTVAVDFWFERWLRRWLCGFHWQLSPWHTRAGLHPRAWCCELAIIAFYAAAVEGFAHSMLAWSYDTTANPVVGIIIAVLPNYVALLVQYWIWSRTIYRRGDPNPKQEKWWQDRTHPNWFFAELLLGAGYLFMLGAGLYIGPAFVMLDALFRCGEALGWQAPYKNATYEATPDAERAFVGFGLIVKGVVFVFVGWQWPTLWGGDAINWWILGIGAVEALPLSVLVLLLLRKEPAQPRRYGKRVVPAPSSDESAASLPLVVVGAWR